MELQAITCPKCGGVIQAPLHEKTCYCTFCGTQVFFDDGSRTITYRTVDEARIREIDLEARRLELEERNRPKRVKTMIVLAIIGAVLLILGWFAGQASGDPDSAWYMISMLGMFALFGVVFIWLENGDNNSGRNPNKRDR